MSGAFFAVVLVVGREPASEAPSQAASAAPTMIEADAQPVAVPVSDAAPPAVDASIQDASIEIDAAAPTPTVAEPTPRPSPSRPPPTQPAPRSPPSPQPPAPGSAAAPPPPPADDCDEAGCVAENYARPCCAKYRPNDPGLARRIDGVPETLDRVLVRTGVSTVKPAIIGCGEATPVKGTVKLSVTVAPAGTVTSASVVASPDSTLGSCVADAMRKARFSTTIRGATFTYPFVF